ncbi:tetratricopeptide repeat protein [Olleya sp. AH-315-F22]|nr:tetratricopeptide repeat protein [Olleya sp. AH-315-F22]
MNKYIFILISILILKAEAQSSALQLGDSLYINGNYTKAIEAYKQFENQRNVYDKIAKAFVAIGNYDEALSNYKSSIETNPNNALIKYEFAKLLSKTKKHEAASTMFYKLIDIDYKNPNYHYELGLVLEQLKDSTAQNRFRSAFDLDSTHQKAIFRIARFHVKKRHFKTANKYINIGLSTYAENKQLISLKAQNHYWKEDYEDAVIWFEKLLALNESTQFIHEKLSFSYVRIYEYKKALEQGELALKLDPKNATNLYIQGLIYERMQDYENAEKYILESLAIQDIPLDTEYSKLANIYNQQKKYKEGIEAFQQSIKENPDSQHTQFFLVYTKDRYYKDIDTRIMLYKNFLEKNPKSMFKSIAEKRITELKEEQFLKHD